MKKSNSFLKKFQNFAFHQELFEEKDKIVVGVSGGPDSTCLVRAFLAWQRKYDLNLQLVHINYGLRGDESDQDEQFVRDLAKKFSLPLEVSKVKSQKSKVNLEQEMREFRYNKFEEVRRELDFDWIAIGHTKDDQVETFLFNLLRGAGSTGLASIQPKRNQIIRPLLSFTKQECLNFLNELGQNFREDKSNQDLNFTRNRIRHKLIPLLEKKYNPNFKDATANLCSNLQTENKIVNELVEKKFNKLAKEENYKISLETNQLKKLNENQLKLVLREVIEKTKGDLKDITFDHIFEIEKIINSPKGKNQKVKLKGVAIEKKGEKLVFNPL